MVLDILLQQAALASVLLIVGLILYECVRIKPPFQIRPQLPKLPVVGAKKGEWFSAMKAMWRNTVDVRTATQEAYQFKDQLCLLPILDLGCVVIIPPTEIDVCNFPEHLTPLFGVSRVLRLKILPNFRTLPYWATLTLKTCSGT